MKARSQRMKRLVGKGEKDERGRREERGKWWVSEGKKWENEENEEERKRGRER